MQENRGAGSSLALQFFHAELWLRGNRLRDLPEI